MRGFWNKHECVNRAEAEFDAGLVFVTIQSFIMVPVIFSVKFQPSNRALHFLCLLLSFEKTESNVNNEYVLEHINNQV